MKYLRLGEMRNSALYGNRTKDRAVKDRVRPLQEVAADAARRILADHAPTPLDGDVDRDVRRIVREGEKALLKKG